MAISCDPNDLVQAAACFRCLPPGAQMDVMTYLLAQIAGGSTDPNTLMQQAACMKCIPKGMQLEVQTSLLCQIAYQVFVNANVQASGVAQLVGGTATVNTPAANAANPILLTYYSLDGNVATLSYGTIVSGTSFVITSSNGADTNLVSWAILTPS